jgi:hypothetical protein
MLSLGTKILDQGEEVITLGRLCKEVCQVPLAANEHKFEFLLLIELADVMITHIDVLRSPV